MGTSRPLERLGATGSAKEGLGASGGSGGMTAAAATGGAGVPAAKGGAPVAGLTYRPVPSPEATLDFKSVPADDLAAVMATIIRQCFERRVRAADLFVDFDKSRRGEIHRIQFIRGLRAASFMGVSPAAMAAVADAYALASDPTKEYIRWTDFADDVERAFTEKGLEKDPTKELDSFAHTVVTAPHPRLVRPDLPPAATAALARALADIKHRIKTWRTYNVKAMLQDYDKAREGLVTETQFLRVLAAFNLVPVAAEQRSALLDYFRGLGHKSYMIDYRQFLQTVYDDGVE